MAVDDALLPAARYLTGPGARPLVEAAVRAAGGALVRLRPAQVLYRPGQELVVRYAATVGWSGRGPVDETLLAGTTAEGPPPGTVPVEAEGMSAGVWRYPFDPYLPGLDAAVRAERVGGLLGMAGRSIVLDVRSFRPTRRAVVHASWDGGEAYLKVLPPAEAVALSEIHRRLAAAGLPVPLVIAVDVAAGVVALDSVGRQTVRGWLLEGRRRQPTGRSILTLLDRLAEVDVPRPAHRRATPLAVAAGHGRMLAAVLPSAAGRIGALCERIGAPHRMSDTATVHGDLHDGQLAVDGRGRITAMLDVDAVGPGERVDDLANLLGHLASLELSSRPAAGNVRTWADELHGVFAAQVDAAELDRRVAAVLLGLATGPFRVQERAWRTAVRRRLSLAERWAGRGERTLRTAS
jgi:hypothetical protein